METAIRVKGFSDVECACGCHNLLPLTIYNRGWRYLRAHKGARNGESVGDKAIRVASKSQKPSAVAHTSYQRMLDMVVENRAAAGARLAELLHERLVAEVRVKEMSGLVSVVEAEIEKLNALGDALDAVMHSPSKASTTAESEAA
jgi:hypothetical protein